MTRRLNSVCEEPGLRDIVANALRHSSIVLGIAEGRSVGVVPAVHDTSVAMIEEHYSCWIVDDLEELVATAIVPLTGEAA